MAMIATRSDAPWAFLPTMAQVALEVMESPSFWNEVWGKKDSSYSPDKRGVSTGFIVGPGPSQRWSETGNVPVDMIDAGRTKTTAYEDFGISLYISRNAQEDELFGVYAEAANALPNSHVLFRNLRMGQFLNNAFNTTFYTDDSPTAKAILATDHASVNGASRPNILTVGESLTYDSLQKLLTLAWNHNNEKGYPDPIFSDGEEVILMVRPADGMLAHKIVSSMYQPTDDTNAVNPISTMKQFRIRVVINPFITSVGSGNYWFLIGTKSKPANLVERRAPEVSKRTDPQTKATVVDLTAREAVAVNNIGRGYYSIFGSGNA